MKLFILTFLFLCGQSLFAQDSRSAMTAFNINNKTDIDKIITAIGNKRIVAIGEDTHGTKEYYNLRIAITKKLITEKGFNVFILEDPHEDMVALQDELYTDNIDSLMSKHLFAIYQTKEMEAFLIWLRSYNKTHKIKLAGSDDSYREILPAKIRSEIKKYKDHVLDSLAEDFENRQLLDIEEYYDLPKNKSTRPLPDDLHYGYDTYLTAVKIDSLMKAAHMKNERLAELVYHAISNYDIYMGYMNKIFLSRDSAMGNRINYFAENKKNKIIIWANNGHIAKHNIDGEIGKMGETVSKKNPGQYFALGFATGGGTYSYINTPFINDDHDFSDTLFQEKFLPLMPGSWHDYLNTQKGNDFLINFNTLDQKQIAFFNTKKPFRIVGYKKENPEKTIFNTPLYPLFDALIFIKKTSGTTPLFFQH